MTTPNDETQEPSPGKGWRLLQRMEIIESGDQAYWPWGWDEVQGLIGTPNVGVSIRRRVTPTPPTDAQGTPELVEAAIRFAESGDSTGGLVTHAALITMADEIKRLRQSSAELEKVRNRLCIGPQGDDNIDMLESSMAYKVAELEKVKAENERLKEKVGIIKRAAMEAVGGCETWPDVLSEGPKLRSRIVELQEALQVRVDEYCDQPHIQELVRKGVENEDLRNQLTTERAARTQAEREREAANRDRETFRSGYSKLYEAQTSLDKQLAALQSELETREQWIAQLEQYAGAQILMSDFQTADQMREAYERLQSEMDAAKEDKELLDWLLDFITQHGGNGISDKILWTVVEEDEGDAMLDRADVVFDRDAIHAARKTP